MQEYIGEEGISLFELESYKQKIFLASQEIFNKKNKMSDWVSLPFEQDKIINQILDYANQKINHDQIKNFVLFGIGGSALGPLALHQAINNFYYNELSREARNNFPKFYVLDNIDPDRLAYLLKIIDLDKTLFNIISKSGNTCETMSQFIIIKDLLEKKLGANHARENIICTTDSESGSLLEIARDKNYKIFFIPTGVGGRFSELSPVGLIPAAFTGIDIKELLAGAKFIYNICKNNPEKNIASCFALINYLAYKNHNKNISVMMPYADSLKYISDWYAQLWAESLGKELDNNNKKINSGQTPVKSLGVTDQHSQLQLYNSGPFDKIINLIELKTYREEIIIPEIFDKSLKNLSFLENITHNKLIQTELIATEFALTKSKRMNIKIILPELNEFIMGELFFMLELATAYAGELLNINAFDQPGVEESKNLTYALFNKPGYENKKQEFNNAKKKNKKYII